MIQRDRAWRRAQKKKRDPKTKKAQIHFREKNWKYPYTRSDKLRRAKMLGFKFPIRSWYEELNE